MAVKMKVVGGQTRLVPTTEEVYLKLDDELRFRLNAHAAIDADKNTRGHTQFSDMLPLPCAPEASAGNTNRAADAGHVHKLPRLDEILPRPNMPEGYVPRGALEKEHEDVIATSDVLAHVRLVADFDSMDEHAAAQMKAVSAKINSLKEELQAQLTALQTGVSFYASYFFGRTKTSTVIDGTDAKYTPQALASRLGITTAGTTVSLFDFTGNSYSYYLADSGATSWGEPHSILTEDLNIYDSEQNAPNNGTQIGISGFFIDIQQNTDDLWLPGYATFSKAKGGWDLYPDKFSSIDNNTIVLDTLGRRKVSDYSVTETSADYTDWEVGIASTSRDYFSWLTAFFRKIRGLRNDLKTEKLERTADVATIYDKLGEHASQNVTFDEQPITPEDPAWAPEATPAE